MIGSEEEVLSSQFSVLSKGQQWAFLKTGTDNRELRTAL
jgi:hypothetical protein